MSPTSLVSASPNTPQKPGTFNRFVRMGVALLGVMNLPKTSGFKPSPRIERVTQSMHPAPLARQIQTSPSWQPKEGVAPLGLSPIDPESSDEEKKLGPSEYSDFPEDYWNDEFGESLDTDKAFYQFVQGLEKPSSPVLKSLFLETVTMLEVADKKFSDISDIQDKDIDDLAKLVDTCRKFLKAVNELPDTEKRDVFLEMGIVDNLSKMRMHVEGLKDFSFSGAMSMSGGKAWGMKFLDACFAELDFDLLPLEFEFIGNQKPEAFLNAYSEKVILPMSKNPLDIPITLRGLKKVNKIVEKATKSDKFVLAAAKILLGQHQELSTAMMASSIMGLTSSLDDLKQALFENDLLLHQLTQGEGRKFRMEGRYEVSMCMDSLAQCLNSSEDSSKKSENISAAFEMLSREVDDLLSEDSKGLVESSYDSKADLAGKDLLMFYYLLKENKDYLPGAGYEKLREKTVALQQKVLKDGFSKEEKAAYPAFSRMMLAYQKVIFLLTSDDVAKAEELTKVAIQEYNQFSGVFTPNQKDCLSLIMNQTILSAFLAKETPIQDIMAVLDESIQLTTSVFINTDQTDLKGVAKDYLNSLSDVKASFSAVDITPMEEQFELISELFIIGTGFFKHLCQI